MATLTILVILFVSLAALYEGWRRSTAAARECGDENSNRLRTADEELPTETGRFKVQEMLRRTADKSAASHETPEASAQHDEKQNPEQDNLLPDPFSKQGG